MVAVSCWQQRVYSESRFGHRFASTVATVESSVRIQNESRRTWTAGERHAANHFELSFTNYEFLLDFGQSYDSSDDALIHTRIILSPRNANTLSRMLADLVEQYRTRLPQAMQELE